jgi:hypothetical protein
LHARLEQHVHAGGRRGFDRAALRQKKQDGERQQMEQGRDDQGDAASART